MTDVITERGTVKQVTPRVQVPGKMQGHCTWRYAIILRSVLKMSSMVNDYAKKRGFRLPRAETRGFLALFFLLGACAVAPIWVTRFLPLLDEPNHLSAMYIWTSLSDPLSPLHAFYETRVAPVSYLLHYGLVYLFSKAVGVEAAHKITLSLYVLALPSAAYFWCRLTGRSPWLGLLTLPLAFSASWAYGYHPFNLGMAAFFWGVVAYDRLLGAWSKMAWGWSMLASVACYFGHPFPLALLGICVFVLWVVRGCKVGSAARTVTAFSPSLILLFWQAGAASLVATAPSEALGLDFPVIDIKRWLDRLLDLPQYAVNPFAGSYDSFLFVLLVTLTIALWIGLAIGAKRPNAVSIPATLVAHRGLWITLVLLVLYLILPEHLNEPVYMWIARGRIAPAIGFFLLLSPPLQDKSRGRWIVLMAALAALPLYFETGRQYGAFGRHMKGMENALEACPPDEQVLTVRLGDQMVSGFDVPVLRELSSWVQVVHGGYAPMSFNRPIPFPFIKKAALPAPYWLNHERFRYYLNPRKYGCVIVYGNHGDFSSPSWKLMQSLGMWNLYLANRPFLR